MREPKTYNWVYLFKMLNITNKHDKLYTRNIVVNIIVAISNL